VGLYIHPPPIRLNGIVLNQLSTGTTSHFYSTYIFVFHCAKRYCRYLGHIVTISDNNPFVNVDVGTAVIL
jgi:hypothetical protein